MVNRNALDWHVVAEETQALEVPGGCLVRVGAALAFVPGVVIDPHASGGPWPRARMVPAPTPDPERPGPG